MQKLKDKISYVRRLHQTGQSEKLHQTIGGRYIKDIVFGANDGIITTFAVVSGVAGAGLSTKTVLILGFANLIADGISMGASNFLGSRSEEEYYRKEYEAETWEVENIPDEEREEIRRIYKAKGFKGEDLDSAVEVITSDKKRWVDVMMKEELGLIEEPKGQAGKKGLVTFVSFVIAGFMPLASYVLFFKGTRTFLLSIVITGVTLFIVGSMRTLITKRKWWLAGLEMFAVGLLASGVAYAIGAVLKGIM